MGLYVMTKKTLNYILNNDENALFYGFNVQN